MSMRISIVVEHDSTGLQYRAPAGWVFFQNHPETIRVKNGEPVTFEAQWTEWGPIIAPAPAPEKGRLLALRWNAHDPAATNLGLLAMETVGAAAEAIAVGRRAGNRRRHEITPTFLQPAKGLGVGLRHQRLQGETESTREPAQEHDVEALG